jgi:hypothetical protein
LAFLPRSMQAQAGSSLIQSTDAVFAQCAGRGSKSSA